MIARLTELLIGTDIVIGLYRRESVYRTEPSWLRPKQARNCKVEEDESSVGESEKTTIDRKVSCLAGATCLPAEY